MAEYRALRERHSLLEICRNPDLATEVTLQPVGGSRSTRRSCSRTCCCRSSRWGCPSTSSRARGRRSSGRSTRPADIDALRVFEPREALAHVLDAIRQIQAELGGRVPLIGFAGAPFTLASYAIEGGHSNNFAQDQGADVRPSGGVASALREACRPSSPTICVAQIEAGVDAVQVFDSWVGALNAADYREFALPHTRRIFEAVGRTRADDSLRHRHGDDPRRAARRRRRRHRRRLAHPDRRGVGAHRRRPRACRATSIRRCCSARRRGCSSRPTTC